ncbi:MAG TPA: PilN domain-containing protein [Roseiarcus sp.]|nr:PilN domain-containing protein [Roseiarcus sp.]
MSALNQVIEVLSRGVDDAALGFARAYEVLRRPRKLQLVEQADGGFVLRPVGKTGRRAADEPRLRIEDGEFVGVSSRQARTLLARSRVELVLASSRFVFRELELPRRAGEFLDGIVRAQIDRLTPWKPQEAAFGWSAPADLGGERIVVTIAATPRASIAALARALETARIESLAVSTHVEGVEAEERKISVFSQRPGGELRMRLWRRAMVGGLALAGAATAVSAAAAIFAGGDLEAQQDALRREIASRRAALLSGSRSLDDPALAALNAKKRATPASVVVIEALSRTLPDSAYLTQLHIEDGKVQLAGLAEDVPGLIRLIERSRHFTHAAFSAPTTNTPTERGERFHIEAHVEPVFAVTP